MKTHLATIATAFGIFLSCSTFAARAGEAEFMSTSIPHLPQDKANGEDDEGDDSAISSGGEISDDENICNGGTPTPIENMESPTGDFDGLLMIRWEKRTMGGDWTVIPSATVLNYAPDPIFETTEYRRGCRESILDHWQYSNVVLKKVVQGIEEVKITSINVTCKGGNNGHASTTVIGGAPEFEYDWSVSDMNSSEMYDLEAGSYSVTVTDANGCSATADFEIREPESSVQINNVYPLEPFCPGEASGAIFVEAWDGVPPYTFSWSDGHTDSYNIDIPAGTYEVTVEDALGCTHTISDIELGEPDAFELAENSVAVTCFGSSDGATEVEMNGGTEPYAYFWEDGHWESNRDNLEAGVYHVAVQDRNGCISVHQIEIESPDPISPESITLDNKICKASINMVPTGGTAPFSYEWNDGSTSGYIGDLCPGTYTVTITDANGCKKEETLEIRAEYAIKSIDIEILVNPFHKEGNVIIHLPYDQPADIEVYSPSGQLVETFYSRIPQEDKEINVKLDLNKYSNGIYLVNVRSTGLSGTEKVVISKQ